MLWKCCTQYASKFGKVTSGHRTGKGQFSFQSQRRAMPKNVQTTIQLCSFCMLGRLCLKSFKLVFSSTWTKELLDVQAGFRRSSGTRDQIANICWITEKAREFQKNIYCYFTEYMKALITWTTTNYGKFLKWLEYQTTLPVSWETCMQAKKQQWEPYMEQWTGSNLGKENVKAVYCHPTYLTSMQSTSCKIARLDESQAGIKIAGRNINNLR